ncbi:HDOD domain-containing protein [bacterium]|nr:HDOD domain-containing protein [bacterium]MBU1983825.1 HDOD domain-containing protein [bacterium]
MNQRERVALALREVKTLPTLPDVAVRLLETSDDPNVSTREIAAIVGGDMALASRVLKLVNSPFFGMSREVTSVQQALVIIGMANLRSMVLSSALVDLFDKEGAVGDFNRREFWKHSVAVAIAARALAKHTRVVDTEIAFTAGLLHDMGKVVVDRYLHPEFVRIVELLEDEDVPMTEAEMEVLGVNHAELGQHLAGRWNLPEILQEAVGFHHGPREATKHAPLAALVMTADAIARRAGVGQGGGADHPLYLSVLELCGLDLQKYDRIANDLSSVLEEQVTGFAREV